MLRLTVALFMLLLVAGCSYQVSLDPNIDPTANIANPMKLRVGLFITEETKAIKTSDRITPLVKYTFDVGPALESIITKSVKRAFTSVDILESHPTPQLIKERRLNLTIFAKSTSAKTTLNYKHGFFSVDANGTTSLSAQLTVYNAELLQVALILGTGIGIASEGYSWGTGKKQYRQSVEWAIRHLGDELVQQIYGNYDIRKLAETLAHDEQ